MARLAYPKREKTYPFDLLANAQSLEPRADPKLSSRSVRLLPPDIKDRCRSPEPRKTFKETKVLDTDAPCNARDGKTEISGCYRHSYCRGLRRTR
ncbi:hypothetical protein N7540_004146 [Penicillium herquei]|nr:hypothetical protein N7540_004146 [Penicillium herquei]